MNNHNILKELYKKEQCHEKLFTAFRPNLKRQPLAGKFYARHETRVGQPDKKLMELIKREKSDGPKEKYLSPQTGNQEYGWNIKPFIPRNKDIFIFPHRKVKLF
jgi:hypothetical protein